jgi:predicted MFS family arabinose efflux permease
VDRYGGRSATSLILPVLCLCSFAVPFNNYILSPILVDVSADLGVSLATAGLLGTIFAIPASVLALVMGPLSDKYGRRPILAFGVATLAFANLLSALAWSFPALAAFRFLGGFGTAALSPTMFAAVGDAFDYRQRGRAIGSLMSANTMAMALGIPIAAVLAGLFHWRVAYGFLAVSLLIALAVLLTQYPRIGQTDKQRPLRAYFREYAGLFGDRSVLSIYLGIILNGVGYVAWLTYMGAFFVERFSLPTQSLALVTATLGFGVVAGSNLGGRIGDRIGGHKGITVASGFVASAALLIQTHLVAWLPVGALVNFVFGFPMGARFTSMLTMLSEQNPEARGRLLAMNTNGFQFGVVVGAALGGTVVEGAGYGMLGVVAATLIAASGVIVWIGAQERSRPSASVAAS